MNKEFMMDGILSERDADLLNEILGYRLTKGAYRAFTSQVKGKEDCKWEDVRIRLIRNIILSKVAKKYEDQNEFKDIYLYGNLIIHVNRQERKICYVQVKKGNFGFRKHMVKYEFLNGLLGIE